MANFDQNVTIHLNVESEVGAEMGAAAGEIKTVKETLEGLDGDFQNTADSLDDFADSARNASESIAPDIDLSGVREEIDDFERLGNALEKVEEGKSNVSGENEILSTRAEDTADSTRNEAKAFHELIDSGSSLASIKEAAANSNEILNESNKKTARSALLENENIRRLTYEGVLDLDEALEQLNLTHDETQDKMAGTSRSTNNEAGAFHNLIDASSSLADVKQAAADSNKMLDERNKQTARSAIKETRAFRVLQEQGFETAEILDAFSATQRRVGDDSERTSGKTNLLRNSLDEMTDSMRAADKVGGIFEDGLGSLSVNLGAFTVALRNMLTQIPILMSGLSSLGSTVLGVAGAFGTAGVAIASAIGGGAIAQAQQLKSEYSEIESLGESLQVMMAGMRDMFLQALQPLTEQADVIGIFEQIITGMAEVTSVFADAFAQIMPEVSTLVDTLGEELAEPWRHLSESLTGMFLILKDEFADMTVSMVQGFSNMIRFVTMFSNGMTEANSLTHQFVDTLADMAGVGQTVFEGLKPILTAFLSAAESVAEVINSVNTQFLAAGITVAVLIGALNRMGGVIGSLISVIPNLSFAIKDADGSLISLLSSAGDFLRQNPKMLGGITALVESVENLSDEFAVMALRTEIAEDSFEQLGKAQAQQLRNTILSTESMEDIENALVEAALAADLTTDEIDDLNDELAQTSINARLAEENLDSLDGAEVDMKTARKTALKGATETAAVGVGVGGADAVGRATKKADGIKKTFSDIATKGLGGGIFSGGIIAKLVEAVGSLSTVLGYLPPVMAAIAITGGLAVGVMGNLDSIMNALSATGKALGDMFMWIANQAISIFIAVWNALYDIIVGVTMIIKPFIDFLKILTGGGESAASSFDALVSVLEFVVDVVVGIIETVGKVIRLIATLIGGFIQFGQIITVLARVGFHAILDSISQWLAGINLLNDGASTTASIFDRVLELISMIPDALTSAIKGVQSFMNDFIDTVNEGIRMANRVSGSNMETINRVEFGVGEGEGGRVSRGELDAQTDEMFEGAEGKKQPNLTYNEDNSTNIDQTVNADPEDKAQLSRVVTDAVAEANSFERRRQGGQ